MMRRDTMSSHAWKGCGVRGPEPASDLVSSRRRGSLAGDPQDWRLAPPPIQGAPSHTRRGSERTRSLERSARRVSQPMSPAELLSSTHCRTWSRSRLVPPHLPLIALAAFPFRPLLPPASLASYRLLAPPPWRRLGQLPSRRHRDPRRSGRH